MNDISPAPVAFFAYKRLLEFNKSIRALQQNYLAPETELYIFVDGPKSSVDLPKVEQVKELARRVNGFKQVHFHLSDSNKGCSKSIIDGLSLVLTKHDRVIVVEDDIVTTPNFLDYLNQGLNFYRDNKQVFSIGAYTFPFKKPHNYSSDIYFYGRTCAWGWGIWADRWATTDWTLPDYNKFLVDLKAQKRFNYYGSDRVRMLRRAVNNDIDSWDIRLCYNQFRQNRLTAFPTVSKTLNIGFNGSDGTNTNNYNRYETEVDAGIQRHFNFPIDVVEDIYYTSLLRRKFSVSVRLINRVKTYFMRS